MSSSLGHFGRAVPVTLRRFPFLHAKTIDGGAPLLLPSELPNAPFHVITLNFKNSHVWNARTWAGLHSSLDILSQHHGHKIGDIYHLFIFPSFYRLWSLIWKKRCKNWAQENRIPESNVLLTYGDREAICDDIGIINDGRQYAFLLRNTGKVIFAADGRYIGHKHDIAIQKAVRSFFNEGTIHSSVADVDK